MIRRTLVLTGSTGFIGSAVLRELARQPDRGLRIRVVGRHHRGEEGGPHLEFVRADLTDSASLRGVCENADILVHAASYVGSDPDTCRSVNEFGSGSLVREARSAGVRRIVHVSTAAVYGRGPHRGIDVDGIEPAPVSPASRSRLAAEGPVLAEGGLVLRPGLVLGAGDRWVVPALADLVSRVPYRWDGGRALLSVVRITDLARLITAAATAREAPSGVYHASHPLPVRNAELMSELAAHGVLPPVTEDLPWEQCVELLRVTKGWTSERQFGLLAQDHHYRSEAIWRSLNCRPGPRPPAGLASATSWYRAQVGVEPVPGTGLTSSPGPQRP